MNTSNTETWRPVPGHDGYEASDEGRVRSVRHRSPHVLVATTGPCGFLTLTFVDCLTMSPLEDIPAGALAFGAGG